ncbi:GNAT family N-acetyltransferase [Streptomyces sp. DW26H14]|uniref:GNAT family N-acetyltransferase n=1 Tax=Streptomyces sp. DW26H14 TaxID=3435395 RepID=UPI00403D766C
MSTLSHDLRVRHVLDDDWDAVVGLESDTYAAAGLSEGRAALESRVSASPSTCFVLHVDGRLAGYVLALPYPEAAYPELAGTDATTFESANLHLHDLVIAEDLRGRGLGGHLLSHLTAVAATAGFERISLVAVGGSDTFWAGNGFTAHAEIVPTGDYGADAVYMSRTVPAEAAAPAGRPAVTVPRARAVAAGRTASQEPRPGRPSATPAPTGGAPRTNGFPPRGSSPHPHHEKG